MVNKTPFELKVKLKKPCNKTTGKQIALIEKGGNITVTDDFIVESSAAGIQSVLVGDPFDLWVGDSTWMDITSTFHVTYDESIPHNSYLAYTQIGSSAAKNLGMYVIIKNQLNNADVYIKSQPPTDRNGWKGTKTLCQLKVFNSTCLVRNNFIGEIIINGKVDASTDIFSTWWGDSSYNSANTTMVLTRKGNTGSYITMTNVGYGKDVVRDRARVATNILLE